MAPTRSDSNLAPIPRVALIDLARGTALIAMAIYHLTWDLEYFGYLQPGTTLEPVWKYFARSIAASFLLLVGISIVLAHIRNLHKRTFIIRLAKVSAAAALISIVTWLAMPGGFIFFGILHAIALGSVFALAFLRLPWLVLAVLSAFFIAGAVYFKAGLFDYPLLYWLGLSPTPPNSNDYVPIFPWFGLILLGMSMARLGLDHGFLERISRWQPKNLLTTILSFLSRYSLLTYLVHQPLLLGMVYLFVALTGGPDRTPAFINSCEANCELTRNEPFCRKFCACITGELKSQNLWSGIHNRQINISTDKRVQAITRSCSIQPNSE